MVNREYYVLSDANGSIKVSEDVIARIATNAALDTEGVAALAAVPQGDLSEIFNKRSASRGVRISINENQTCDVDVYVLVAFSQNVTDVAKNLQQNVKNAIESMISVEVSSVDVFISGVAQKQK